MLKMRDTLGYILGFLIFVVGVPALMWLVSGRPFPWAPSWPLVILAAILMVIGLTMSIWSIVHMRKVGQGNPFDAYNHEVAPRTKHLMTDGPYGFSRNPMLLGIYIYNLGVLLWLHCWWPFAVFAVEIILLSLQVRSEEKRLEADFGDEYRDYKQRVPRYFIKERN